MSRAHLRFSTDILKRLGEELNPNPDQGILELVKNAYDADARNCVVELISTHEAGGEIRVTDDGDGMGDSEIIDGWLVLGKSSKSKRQVTRLGRRPVGNKGLGRLAALRLGSSASLVSRPLRKPDLEYKLDIDWEKFDRATIVEDIPLEIKRTRRLTNEPNGTEVIMSSVRSPISRIDVRRLARGIVLLADPFGDDPIGFQPILKAPEFSDFEKLVQRRYFLEAELHLTAQLDNTGRGRAAVLDWRGNTLYEAEHSEIAKKNPSHAYSCPPASFDLWTFTLDRRSFITRTAKIGEVKDWLSEFGGVHLYVRGLRVAPYGNPGNDWLDLNLSRVRSPELRPSTNNSIGRIAIADDKDELPQKTDRSGLVEGLTFHELKRFAVNCLEWMARRRKDEWDAKRSRTRVETPRKVEEAKVSLNEAFESLPTKNKRRIRSTFEAYDKLRNKEVQSLRKEVQLYRTLSTAGITASVFAHESNHPIQLILQNAKQVERRGREIAQAYEETLGPAVTRILRQAGALRNFADLTLSFIDYEKRRSSKVEVHTVIKRILTLFEPLLNERQVRVVPSLAEKNPFLRASEAAIESIITNLLVNSLKAFEQMPPGDRQIEIKTELTNGHLRLRVLDSGPGIQGIALKDIWLPGETTYPNGTGLGLTIVRDTVRDLGGDVSALARSELGGAELIADLPILGAS